MMKEILKNQLAIMEVIIRMANAFPYEQTVLRKRIKITEDAIKAKIATP